VSPIVLLGALIVAGGIYLTVWSVGRRRDVDSDPLSARLRVYDGFVKMTEEEIELNTKSFSERVVQPAVEKLGNYLSKRVSANQRQALQFKMDLAGRPANLSPEDFMAIRIGLAILLFIVGLGLGFFMHTPLYEAIGAAVGAALGYFGPMLWLNQKVGDRRKQIQRALPDALDLLTISVEAGLAFDAAVVRVVEKFHNALTDELNQVSIESKLGRPRLEALDAMGRRCGVPDLHNFVQAIIQSEQMGVGIARILRLQSDEIRRKRRQYAQEKAAQATLKMLLPMVGCIFPTLWIVLLGPAILIIIKTRGSG